jgi:hypothetical protein
MLAEVVLWADADLNRRELAKASSVSRHRYACSDFTKTVPFPPFPEAKSRSGGGRQRAHRPSLSGTLPVSSMPSSISSLASSVQAAIDSLADLLAAHRRLWDEHILEPDAAERSAAKAERYHEQLTAFRDFMANIRKKATPYCEHEN